MYGAAGKDRGARIGALARRYRSRHAYPFRSMCVEGKTALRTIWIDDQSHGAPKATSVLGVTDVPTSHRATSIKLPRESLCKVGMFRLLAAVTLKSVVLENRRTGSGLILRWHRGAKSAQLRDHS